MLKVDLMEQGKRLAQQRDKKTLVTARQNFTTAQDILLHSSNLDRSALVQVLYQLMNVEFKIAFSRDLSPAGKLSGLQKAEQYGWEASHEANVLTIPGDATGIKLYMAVIKGRKAEVHSKLGVQAKEIRKQKDEALSEIFLAMEEIRASGSANVKDSEDFANTWTQRLQVPTSELETPIIPYPVELGSCSNLC